jgi:hypothetical protein
VVLEKGKSFADLQQSPLLDSSGDFFAVSRALRYRGGLPILILLHLVFLPVIPLRFP